LNSGLPLCLGFAQAEARLIGFSGGFSVAVFDYQRVLGRDTFCQLIKKPQRARLQANSGAEAAESRQCYVCFNVLLCSVAC